MTTRRPGRPAKGAAPLTLTPFGAAVIAALLERWAVQAAGPRTLADLARATGAAKPNLQRGLDGRCLSAAMKAAIIRALPEVASAAEPTPPTP